jgi:cysteine synthase A
VFLIVGIDFVKVWKWGRIMARIAGQLTELIGHTPLLELSNIEQEMGLSARLIAKLEYYNPLGSVKDRVAYSMIEDGIRRGEIDDNTVIIEPTSGNTGIGLAFVCASKKLRLILTMPDTMSVERRKIVTALGAEVVLTQGRLGMKGAIEKAEELKAEYGNAFIPQQFKNPSNPAIHVTTTAREILEDTDGRVDIFVASVGTGGTITGTARGLREQLPDVKVVAVEPAGSPVLSGGKPGPHKIQGIGAGFIPDVLDMSLIDEIIQVSNEDAYDATRAIAKSDGLLIGVSSGAVIHAGLELARRPENEGKNIVILLPDSGERYLSTSLFEF